MFGKNDYYAFKGERFKLDKKSRPYNNFVLMHKFSTDKMDDIPPQSQVS